MTVYMLLLIPTAFFAYMSGGLDTMVLASNFVFRRGLWKLGRGNVWLSNFRRIYGTGGFVKLLLVELVKDPHFHRRHPSRHQGSCRGGARVRRLLPDSRQALSDIL